MVVHVIGALVAGGAERFVVFLTKALAGSGLRVELFVLSSRTDVAGEKMRSDLALAGIPTAVGPTEGVGLRSIAWYSRELRRRAGARVHLHTPNTELMHWLAGGFGVARPLLFRTVHNTALPDAPHLRFAYSRNLAACSIACSESVLLVNRNRFAGPFLAIRNGIEFKNPLRTASDRSEARSILRLPAKCLHFVSIGRMAGRSLESAQKAHDVLLRAWRLGRMGDKGAFLHLLGDGPLRPMLEELATGDPTIRFHGTISEVERWLCAADAFVMPSRHEGLPIAGIEAIGAGLPAIFSDIAPLRELTSPEARYVPVGDEAELANAFVAFAERLPVPNPTAVQEFRRQFSIEWTAQSYCDVYKKFA